MSTSSLKIECPRRNLWPVGFGFRPTEEELITHYLENKMRGYESDVESIPVVDLRSYEPHQLPKLSIFESNNHEWFFFRAESALYHCTNAKTKIRTKRTTRTGYWKSTGEDKQIKARGTNKVIGYRKILVFHIGKHPDGVRTNWIIHEYRLHLQHTHLPDNYKRSFVVCRLKEDADQDDDEQNNSVTSRPKRKARRTRIQEVYSHSLLMQPEPISHDNNPTEMLKFLEDELLYDATSNCYGAFSEEQVEKKVNELRLCCGISGDFDNDAACYLQVYSDPEPIAHDNNPTLTEMLECVDFESEFLDDATSNYYGAFSKEQVENKVYELLLCCGISVDTNNDAACNLQHNDIGSLGVHMPTIKESRRSPLPVKHLRLKFKEEDVNELQGGLSSVSSGSGISMNSDYSDGPTSRLSITDSSNGRKSEGGNKYGCVGSKGRGFSCILTTKQIHHKSSVPLVYAAKAFLGIIMFFLFVQEMLLYES